MSCGSSMLASLGIAVNYALKHWDAVTTFIKAGHLDGAASRAEPRHFR